MSSRTRNPRPKAVLAAARIEPEHGLDLADGKQREVHVQAPGEEHPPLEPCPAGRLLEERDPRVADLGHPPGLAEMAGRLAREREDVEVRPLVGRVVLSGPGADDEGRADGILSARPLDEPLRDAVVVSARPAVSGHWVSSSLRSDAFGHTMKPELEGSGRGGVARRRGTKGTPSTRAAPGILSAIAATRRAMTPS